MNTGNRNSHELVFNGDDIVHEHSGPLMRDGRFWSDLPAGESAVYPPFMTLSGSASSVADNPGGEIIFDSYHAGGSGGEMRLGSSVYLDATKPGWTTHAERLGLMGPLTDSELAQQGIVSISPEDQALVSTIGANPLTRGLWHTSSPFVGKGLLNSAEPNWDAEYDQHAVDFNAVGEGGSASAYYNENVPVGDNPNIFDYTTGDIRVKDIQNVNFRLPEDLNVVSKGDSEFSQVIENAWPVHDTRTNDNLTTATSSAGIYIVPIPNPDLTNGRPRKEPIFAEDYYREEYSTGVVSSGIIPSASSEGYSTGAVSSGTIPPTSSSANITSEPMNWTWTGTDPYDGYPAWSWGSSGTVITPVSQTCPHGCYFSEFGWLCETCKGLPYTMNTNDQALREKEALVEKLAEELTAQAKENADLDTRLTNLKKAYEQLDELHFESRHTIFELEDKLSELEKEAPTMVSIGSVVYDKLNGKGPYLVVGESTNVVEFKSLDTLDKSSHRLRRLDVDSWVVRDNDNYTAIPKPALTTARPQSLKSKSTLKQTAAWLLVTTGIVSAVPVIAAVLGWL